METAIAGLSAAELEIVVSPGQDQIQEGLSLVIDKQTAGGLWLCEKYQKGGGWMKQFIEFEEIGQPSKWVTLNSMKMLKALYRR